MTENDLREIETRCNRATKGPWQSFVEGRDQTSGSSFIRTGGLDDIELTGASDEDQDFIAHARQDIPALLAEVRRLRMLVGGSRA
jgi:hypothetical protein